MIKRKIEKKNTIITFKNISIWINLFFLLLPGYRLILHYENQNWLKNLSFLLSSIVYITICQLWLSVIENIFKLPLHLKDRISFRSKTDIIYRKRFNRIKLTISTIQVSCIIFALLKLIINNTDIVLLNDLIFFIGYSSIIFDSYKLKQYFDNCIEKSPRKSIPKIDRNT